MREFLAVNKEQLQNIRQGELAKPLLDCLKHVTDPEVQDE
jgi:hypothetical protein